MSYGYHQGLLERGRFHELGTAGYERNYYKAYKSYQKVPSHIERGESPYRIGELLMEGDKFLERDYNEAKQYYEAAASFGHREARYALGQMYEQGHGVDVDHACAKRYYHQALDVGYTKAAKDIGIMFLRAPSGVLYDLSRAKIYLERFERHCETDADVHIALGDYYRLTKCKDYFSKAAERYHQAIALKEGLGYYWIGQMLEEISSANLGKAVGYYQQGKALKDAKCIRRLAQLNVSGEVVKKDTHAARSDVESKDTLAKPKEAAPSSNFQPLSWDRMRKCFEANEKIKHEKVPIQTNTSIPESDEQLVKIIELPAKHNANVTNFQIRAKITERCSTNSSKPVLQDSDNKPTRGYKFKTKADLKKQLKKAGVSYPLSPFQMLELSTALLQSNQAQITAALETTSKALFKNTLSMTLKLNRMSIENEQSVATIDSNNKDIAKKFEQVEGSVESKYKNVCQRLDVLEKESAEKDKIIELLLSKLNTQSQQLETLIRSMQGR
ncbi:hypothetical protein MAM1_0022d01892 [Mucor ambiguus]|uniref:HCP-like protein n=1 Tax=Mucor ambiguus TaxID=91626 RepID=A0A0C9M6M4_9FUNG|nr:hypothetical protein MAM1_0022d01892 [Mucor ambiguus]